MSEEIEIGRRIRAARKAKGLTGDQLGEKCGVTKGAVSQWENTGRGFNNTTLRRMLDALEVSADSILFGREENAPAEESQVINEDQETKGTQKGIPLTAGMLFEQISGLLKPLGLSVADVVKNEAYFKATLEHRINGGPAPKPPPVTETDKFSRKEQKKKPRGSAAK